MNFLYVTDSYNYILSVYVTSMNMEIRQASEHVRSLIRFASIHNVVPRGTAPQRLLLNVNRNHGLGSEIQIAITITLQAADTDASTSRQSHHLSAADTSASRRLSVPLSEPTTGQIC